MVPHLWRLDAHALFDPHDGEHMYIVTRRMGSQRASRPIKIEVVPNFAGQGGAPFLTFKKPDGTHLCIYPETMEEVKLLLSEVHILHHNFHTADIIHMKLKAR